MTQPIQETVDIGFNMNVRRWNPKFSAENSQQFLLVHGLASNAQTWDQVGRILAETGHAAVAIDQRGHGLSQQLDDGYDFQTITADLNRLLDLFGWDQPIVVGQSWGGNVMTAFGVNYPYRAAGLVMVDGGFLDFGRSDQPWEAIEKRLKPPSLAKSSMEMIRSILESSHPDWTVEGIENTLANLWVNDEGILDRRLKLKNHMAIVRHMYEQNMVELYKKIERPVLICAAGSGTEAQDERKEWIDTAIHTISQASYQWFADADHDIHVQKPRELVNTILTWKATI
ncbi:MAG: alpha/beta hydrolase [Chloroflexota bacterium]